MNITAFILSLTVAGQLFASSAPEDPSQTVAYSKKQKTVEVDVVINVINSPYSIAYACDFTQSVNGNFSYGASSTPELTKIKNTKSKEFKSKSGQWRVYATLSTSKSKHCIATADFNPGEKSKEGEIKSSGKERLIKPIGVYVTTITLVPRGKRISIEKKSFKITDPEILVYKDSVRSRKDAVVRLRVTNTSASHYGFEEATAQIISKKGQKQSIPLVLARNTYRTPIVRSFQIHPTPKIAPDGVYLQGTVDPTRLSPGKTTIKISLKSVLGPRHSETISFNVTPKSFKEIKEFGRNNFLKIFAPHPETKRPYLLDLDNSFALTKFKYSKRGSGKIQLLIENRGHENIEISIAPDNEYAKRTVKTPRKAVKIQKRKSEKIMLKIKGANKGNPPSDGAVVSFVVRDTEKQVLKKFTIRLMGEQI